MGRKSKLTDEQWEEIKTRNLAGESLRSLAREFGVGESTAREKVSAQTAQIKDVAKQILDTKAAISALPVSAQVSAYNLADKMMAVSLNTTDASVAGSLIAKLVNEDAFRKLAKVVEGKKTLTEEDVSSAMKSAMTANTASKIGIDLLTLASRASNGLSDAEIAAMTVEQIEERLSKG